MRKATEAVAAYEECAAEYGGAMQAGDSERANAAYDRLIEILGVLDKVGGRADLRRLLHHPVAYVRLSAATHLLRENPEVGLPVLEKLSGETDLAGFDARMVLSEWKKGTLDLP